MECSTPNSTIQSYIDFLWDESLLYSWTDDISGFSLYYYAFVPDLSNLGNTSARNNGVQQVSNAPFNTPANSSNQLWMAYLKYDVDEHSWKPVLSKHYTTCQLYNSSYDINITFEGGQQFIEPRNVTELNQVDYTNTNIQAFDDLMIQYTYSSYFWAFTDLLVGTMSCCYDTSPTVSTPISGFTDIRTNIESTTLLGSSDLDAFFDHSYALDNVTMLSSQRLQNIRLGQNDTLDILIRELSLNITMSFLSSDLLT